MSKLTINPTSDLDQRWACWTPALRRVVMKVAPEYFSWGEEERERFSVSLTEDVRQQLDDALTVELFGAARTQRKGRRRRNSDTLTLAEQNVFNAAILPFTGIGEDCFYLNDLLPEGQTLLDFGTLREFDENDHRHQQMLRKEEDPAWLVKPYRGALYLAWARFFMDEVFTYGTLSMAAGYLYSRIDEASFDLIQTRIPYRYVDGARHGKVDGNGRQWDQRVDAGGQEALLEALQEKVFAYRQERYEALIELWAARDIGGIYLLDTSEPGEKNVHVVFGDTSALEKVRFRSFVRDCHASARDASEIEAAVRAEHAALDAFIDATHRELQQTIDPNVRVLRKRRRITVHKNAFDDLG